MSILSGRLAVALALAALCLGARTAHAQADPVRYWTPGWPAGFGGNLTVDPGSNSYGNFPSYDFSGARSGGFSPMRYNFSDGWFVGTDGGGTGLSMNGINQHGAFGNSRALSYEGVQFGYNFQNTRGLPLTVFAGFNTLKYNSGIGNPFTSFDATSGAAVGYTAHAGVEYQPTSNLSLSLGFGYTQQPGRLDSLGLPGAAPFSFGDR